MKKLINSNRKRLNVREKINYNLGQIGIKILGAVPPEKQVCLPQNYNFDAHIFSKHFKSTHYGIMVPDLPDPYRYLTCTSIIGDIGVNVTHVPSNQTDLNPADTATLIHGTALTQQKNAYQILSIRDQILLKKEPFEVQYGDTTKIYVEDQKYYLETNRSDLKVKLEMTPTSALTWFSYNKIYQHFSVLMQYKGYFIENQKQVNISGLCTLEHWKCIGFSTVLPKKILNDHLLLPLDSFSYQVINIDAEQQLVLVYTGFAQQPAYLTVSYRNINGTSIQYDGEIIFEVEELLSSALITPDGYQMDVPKSFKWIAYHQGKKVLNIHAIVDTEYCYGLGAGYVSSYSWNGKFEGTHLSGKGYLEYIDRR